MKVSIYPKRKYLLETLKELAGKPPNRNVSIYVSNNSHILGADGRRFIIVTDHENYIEKLLGDQVPGRDFLAMLDYIGLEIECHSTKEITDPDYLWIKIVRANHLETDFPRKTLKCRDREWHVAGLTEKERNLYDVARRLSAGGKVDIQTEELMREAHQQGFHIINSLIKMSILSISSDKQSITFINV